jgi:hypothetical protein
MAEPVWALIVVALGLIDMNANYCATGCLAAREVAPRTALSAGTLVFRDDLAGEEIYLRRESARAFGPFGLGYGISATSNGAVWAGAGIIHTIAFPGSRTYFQSHFMPGVYIRGDGIDLGGPVNARAGVEFGWESRDGVRVGLSIDHRSHGGIFDRNPGLETVQLRVTFPTR